MTDWVENNNLQWVGDNNFQWGIDNYKDLKAYVRTNVRSYRDLSIYLKGFYRSPSDLNNILKGWKREASKNLSSYIKQTYTSTNDLTNVLKIWNIEDTKDLTLVIKGFAKEVTKDIIGNLHGWSLFDLQSYLRAVPPIDLPTNIYAVAPVDLPVYIKDFHAAQRDLSNILSGWQTLNLSSYLNTIPPVDLYASIHTIPPIDLPTTLIVYDKIVQIRANLYAMQYKDIYASLVAIYSRNLSASINAVLPVNISANIHGLAIYDLNSYIVAKEWKSQLYAYINAVRPVDLGINIYGYKGLGTESNLPSAISGYDTNDLSCYIFSRRIFADLPVYLNAKGQLVDLSVSIYPKIVHFKSIINVALLEHIDMKAIINYACFGTGFRDLDGYIGIIYKSDLKNYIKGWLQGPDNAENIYAIINADDYNVENKFILNYLPQASENRYSKLVLRFSTKDKIVVFDNIDIIYNIIDRVQLKATITGVLPHFDLNVTLRPEFDFNYRELPTWIKLKTHEVVIDAENFEEKWRRFVDLMFNTNGDTDFHYFYVSGANKAYRIDKERHWTIWAESYIKDKTNVIERRNVRSKYIFRLSDYNTIDEAVRSLIDRVAEYRKHDLKAYINGYLPPHLDLSAELKPKVIYSWVKHLKTKLYGVYSSTKNISADLYGKYIANVQLNTYLKQTYPTSNQLRSTIKGFSLANLKDVKAKIGWYYGSNDLPILSRSVYPLDKDIGGAIRIWQNIDSRNVKAKIGWYYGDLDLPSDIFGAFPSYGTIWNSTQDTYESVGVYTDVASSMRRCLLNPDGTVNYYLKDDDSTKKENGQPADLSGTDGQVMVEIPKFYYRIFNTIDPGTGDTLVSFYVSFSPFTGAAIHPAFIVAGVEKDYRYVSAYEAVLNYDGLYITSTRDDIIYNIGPNIDYNNDFIGSVSGFKPWTYQSRNYWRYLSTNAGDVFHSLDYNLYLAIQLLFITEYKTLRSQEVLPGYTETMYYTWDRVQETGLTNSIGNSSGTIIGTNGYESDIVIANSYRGIENIYGQFEKHIDGINTYDRTIYTCDDPSKFADNTSTGYTSIELLPSTVGWIKSFREGTLLPASIVDDGNNYTQDFYSGYSTYWRSLVVGGFMVSSSMAGMFSTNCTHSFAYKHTFLTTRLAA